MSDYEPSQQGQDEINEILGELLEKGLPPMTSVALADVRKLMVLAWDRGYTACLENKS